jgi:predicted SnoaL-like aldol condensation-catalyzing enzyme
VQSTTQQRNTQNAIKFYELMFNDNKVREAVELYMGGGYIQHNPDSPDGKDGFIEYFERMAREYPGKKVEIKRTLAEGDYVVVHCLQTWPGDHDYICADFFRFDDQGKAVEHWDVKQIAPADPKNANGMF